MAHKSSVNARFSGTMATQMMDTSAKFALRIRDQVKGVVKTE